MSAVTPELMDALRWMLAHEEAAVDAARARAEGRQIARVDEMLSALPVLERVEDAAGRRDRARTAQRRLGPIALDCVRETAGAVATEQRRLAALAEAVDLLVTAGDARPLGARLEAAIRSHSALTGDSEDDDERRLHREVGIWEACLGSLDMGASALDGRDTVDASGARRERVARRIRLAFNDVLEPFDLHLGELEGESP